MTTTLDSISSQLKQITDLLETARARMTIAPNQIVMKSGLSDIDHRLGLVQAGEFRAGNGKIPGDGFTGVRIGYPSFTYNNEDWHIVGIDVDALQVGIRATDGKLIAGGGNVILNSNGIVIKNLTDSNDAFLIFKNSNDTQLGSIQTSALGNLEVDAFGYDADNEERKLVLRSTVFGTDSISTIEIIANTADTGVDWITLNADFIGITPTAGGGLVYNAANHIDANIFLYGTNASPPVLTMDAGDNAIYIDGDLAFRTDGSGLPYGSFYGNDIAWTQAAAAQNTWYEISDADIADGQLNLVTHDGNGKLTVTKAGRYMINYHLTVSSSMAGKQLQSGISISGTEQNDGIDHETAGAPAGQLPMGSTAILDLAASATVEISLRTTDAGAPDLSVEHINVSIVQVGGT